MMRVLWWSTLQSAPLHRIPYLCRKRCASAVWMFWGRWKYYIVRGWVFVCLCTCARQWEWICEQSEHDMSSVFSVWHCVIMSSGSLRSQILPSIKAGKESECVCSHEITGKCKHTQKRGDFSSLSTESVATVIMMYLRVSRGIWEICL